MRIGLQLFATRRHSRSITDVLNDTVRVAALADELGFDVLWLAEHHDTDWNRCTDPLTLLAHLAARTYRIRLGTAVVNLVLHHPAAVAERAKLVDVLSAGRLELGIGRGFAHRDYQTFGITATDAPAVFRDHHARLLDDLADDQHGRSIPLWLATTGSHDTIDLAARHGHGLLVASGGQRLADLLARAKSGGGVHRLGVTRAVHLGRSRSEAKERAEPDLRWYRDTLAALQPGGAKPDLQDILNRFCILGDPDDCAGQIRQLTDDKITDFTAVFGIGGAPRSAVEESIRHFAKCVMPRLRSSSTIRTALPS